ncbi:MAG: hypothetical protein ACREX3_12700 [Gammaproteobacteria bacterium]
MARTPAYGSLDWFRGELLKLGRLRGLDPNRLRDSKRAKRKFDELLGHESIQKLARTDASPTDVADALVDRIRQLIAAFEDPIKQKIARVALATEPEYFDKTGTERWQLFLSDVVSLDRYYDLRNAVLFDIARQLRGNSGEHRTTAPADARARVEPSYTEAELNELTLARDIWFLGSTALDNLNAVFGMSRLEQVVAFTAPLELRFGQVGLRDYKPVVVHRCGSDPDRLRELILAICEALYFYMRIEGLTNLHRSERTAVTAIAQGNRFLDDLLEQCLDALVRLPLTVRERRQLLSVHQDQHNNDAASFSELLLKDWGRMTGTYFKWVLWLGSCICSGHSHRQTCLPYSLAWYSRRFLTTAERIGGLAAYSD